MRFSHLLLKSEEVPDLYPQIFQKDIEKEDTKRHLCLSYLIPKLKRPKRRYGWITHLIADIFLKQTIINYLMIMSIFWGNWSI